MKTFRFGVNVGPSRSRVEWVEKARKLEDLGYATLTVPDHLTNFFAPMPAPDQRRRGGEEPSGGHQRAQ
jgi:alkanesulfonate monooxygenase SsuD/methylene tetrahydromethanopterin reductase-like flavin-dependent oxidoreductase (luciferase family)